MNAQATLRLAVAVEARSLARINSVPCLIWRRALANFPSLWSKFLRAPNRTTCPPDPRSMIIAAPMIGCTSC